MGIKNVSFALIFFYCLLQISFVFCAKEKGNLQQEASFSYDTEAENGPQNWGELNPNWQACGDGKSQSPIDIPDDNLAPSPLLGDLIKTYKPASALLKREPHDVTLEWEEDAGGITINEQQYNLLRCHWHTPSEHAIDQQRYDAELHLVHQNVDGDIAVLGILYMFGPSDPFLEWILPFLNSSSHESHLGQVNPLWIGLDDRAYYRYNGSLTTPPCSENVTWTVFQRVRTVSQDQVAQLMAAIEQGDLGNARPLQALNGRIPYHFQPYSSISSI